MVQDRRITALLGGADGRFVCTGWYEWGEGTILFMSRKP
jgi:hypothetical protein